MKKSLNDIARRFGIDTKETGMVCAHWGVSINDSQARTSTLTDGAPPLKFYESGSVDLEFGPLLMVDYLVMDSGAFDRIQMEPRTPHFNRLRTSLSALRDEGYVRLVDYTRILSDQRDEILSASSYHAANGEHWLGGLRAAVLGWEVARKRFEGLVTQGNADPLLHIPYGILAHLLDSSGHATEEEYKRVRSVIFSQRKRLTRIERDVVGSCLRPYLQHVFSYIAVRNELGMPLCDWHNLRPLYEPLHRQFAISQTSAEKEQEKVREFFECFVPDYEPRSYKQLLKLLRDDRVKVLRDFIRVAAKERHAFDNRDFQRILVEMYRIDMRKGRFGSGLNMTGLAVGLCLTAAGVDPITSMTAATAVSGMQAVAQKAATHYLEHDRGWLYLLLDNQSHQSEP